MRQFIGAAALAATLFLAPGASLGVTQDLPPQAAAAHARVPEVAPPAPFGLPAAHSTTTARASRPARARPSSAPGSIARRRTAPRSPPSRIALRAEGVADVVPLWQLVRTSSSWRQCGAQPFEVAPRRQVGPYRPHAEVRPRRGEARGRRGRGAQRLSQRGAERLLGRRPGERPPPVLRARSHAGRRPRSAAPR